MPDCLGKKSLALMLLAALAVSGCTTVGPDYQRPEVPIPTGWRVTDVEMRGVLDTAWWKGFEDPVLDGLVEIALQENKDLLIASARVDEYLGRYAIARSDLYPQVGAEVSGDRTRTPDTALTSSSIANDFRLLGLVSYEIDVFGRLRRADEAARAELLATEEGRRTVILSLVAGVVSSYIQLRTLDEGLEISRRTLETRAESLRIAQLRFKAGLTSEMPAQQAESEYASTQVRIPRQETQIAQLENAISLLLGRNPGQIRRGRSLNDLDVPPVPAGLPSELLARRPDILQAEQQLIAANANIGVAKAAYYPQISLTGILGLASPQLEDLFQGSSKTWSFGGAILAPIFTGGKIAGGVQATEAIQRQALANYEQTIQTAFSEVDNSLVVLSKGRERLKAQHTQVKALARYLYLAQLRYDNGYTSYLDVVDASRNLFNAELEFVNTQGDVALALIDLYKSMGGGWVNLADQQAAQPAASQSETTQPEAG